MSEVINQPQKAEVKSQKESKENISSQDRKQQMELIKAINKHFDTFSSEEKSILLSLISKHFNINKNKDPRQLYTEVVKLAVKLKLNPKNILQKLSKLITSQALDQTSLKNKNVILSAKPQKNIEQTIKQRSLDYNKKIEKQAEIIKKTKEAYQNLSPQYKPQSQEQLQAKLSQLKPETQKKLQKQGIDPREYASFLLSRELIDQKKDQSPQTLDFLESLKSLESTLGIRAPDALPLPGFDKEYIKDNPDLIKHIKTNPEFEKLSLPLDFEQMKKPQENFEFVKKFGDKKLHQLQDQVESFFDQNGQLKALDPAEQAIFQEYRQLLVELKHNLSTVSGNMLKAGAMQGPAIALRNYLDQDSLGPLSLTEQFKVGPNTSTILQQGDDQILQIQGKIEGNPITFYYALNNPQANLQCEDTLNYDKDNNQITIGKSQKTDLKIQMPTSVELITRLRDQISPTVLQELLNTANSTEDYQAALNEMIADTIQEAFTADPLVKSRICMHTEKNLATQELNTTLLPPHLETQLNTPNIINNNPQIKKLLYMIDFSSENSTSQELQSFRSGLKKLKNLISNPQALTTIKDPVLKSHLQNLHHAQQNTASLENRAGALSGFLDLFLGADLHSLYINENLSPLEGTINTNDFNNFLDAIMLDKPLDTNPAFKASFSENFTKKYLKAKEQLTTQTDQKALSSLETVLDQQFEENLAFAYA